MQSLDDAGRRVIFFKFQVASPLFNKLGVSVGTILYVNPILHLKLLSPFYQASPPISYWAIRHLLWFTFYLSFLWILIGRHNKDTVDDYGTWKKQGMLLDNSYRKPLLNSHIRVALSILLYVCNRSNILHRDMYVWLDIWILEVILINITLSSHCTHGFQPFMFKSSCYSQRSLEY